MPPLLFLLVLCAPFLTCAERSSVAIAEIGALTSFRLNLQDPLGALDGWDPSSPAAPCDWRGVACYNNRVTELRLPRLQLSGRLTDRLSDLSALRKLSLRSNSFNGTIPSSLGKCGFLRAVFLQYNSLSGTLPPEIRNLTGLQILNVPQNHFSGRIPVDLPLSVEYVDLSSNSFSGGFQVPLPTFLSFSSSTSRTSSRARFRRALDSFSSSNTSGLITIFSEALCLRRSLTALPSCI